MYITNDYAKGFADVLQEYVVIESIASYESIRPEYEDAVVNAYIEFISSDDYLNLAADFNSMLGEKIKLITSDNILYMTMFREYIFRELELPFNAALDYWNDYGDVA